MAEEMTNPRIGLGDAMIMARQGNCDNGWGGAWNNPFMYLIWLAMFGGYGNGGLFGGGYRNSDALTAAAVNEAAIQNTVYQANDQQTLMAMIRDIGNGICDATYALNGTIKDGNYANVSAIKDTRYDLATTINNGNYNLAAATNNGFDAIAKYLMENRFAAQAGLTDLGNKIDGLKFDAAQNTCKITTAMHEEGEATRALIQANTMQALRDKLAEQGAELQNAKFALSQQVQNATIIGALKGNCGCV